MSGDLSRAWQQDILQQAFGRYSTGNLTASTLWIHLYASTLNDASTPASTGRCTGANYAPLNVGNTTGNWTSATAASPSVTENVSALTFTTSASTGWGTLRSVLVSSSSGSGGTAYLWGDLSTAQTVASGNEVKFTAGAFSVSLQ